MKKNRSVLWRLLRATLYLLLSLLIAVFLFLMLIRAGLNDEPVDRHSLKKSLGADTQNQPMTRGELVGFERRRDRLAEKINSEIRAYYKRKGFYPKSLNDLPIARTVEFVQYRRGINYRSGMKNNKPFYGLNWLSSSPWNGMQCVAGIKPKDPWGYELTGEQAKPLNGNCYVLDYH